MNFARELFRLAMLGAVNHQVTHIVVAGSVFAETRDFCERCHPKLGQLVRCHLCFGMWIGFLLALIFRPRFVEPEEGGLPFRRPSRTRQIGGFLADSFAIALAGRFFNEVLAILRNRAAVEEERKALLEKQAEEPREAPDRAEGEPIANPAG